MRNIKVHFTDYGFRSIKGETVAGFHIHRTVRILPSSKVKEQNRGWSITDPNSGKKIGDPVKSRESARKAAREIRAIFDACGVKRSERERDILTKVGQRASDVLAIIKKYA